MRQAARSGGILFLLVLLDAQMPHMDGFPLLARFKCDSRLRMATSAVIMLTSTGDSGRCGALSRTRHSRLFAKPDVNANCSTPSQAISRTVLNSTGATSLAPSTRLRFTRAKCESRLNILLAEDNRVNQILAVRLLEKRGHAVVLVETGEAVLKALPTGSFDLILMDVQMPELDGLQAAARVREDEKTTGKHIPIVAMTAHAMVGDKERCLQAGMDAYIAKPLSVKELFSTIEGLFPNRKTGLEV